MEYIYSKDPKWYVLHTFSGYENVAKMAKRNLLQEKVCRATS